MKWRSFCAHSQLLGATLMLAASAMVWSQEPPRPIDTSAFGKPGADCAELRFVDFSQTPDAITQITDARPLSVPNGPAICQVEGYVWRATRFRLRFPLAEWKGKMIVQGGGGQSGALPNDVPDARRSVAQLVRGYAAVQHNGGHFSTITDAKWSFNDDSAMLDFAFRSPHSATLASRAVLSRFFGKPPARTYYEGCSNSGREAMMMAQRYPADFDGVIAGAPSIAVADLFINMLWAVELLRDQTRAGFDMAAAKTLHQGVLAQCDKRDGKVDGVIDEPRLCRVDLKPLICKAAPAEDCLTERQAEIARKMYDGPRTPDGQQIAASSAFPGSEISWITFITPRWTIDYASEIFRYSAFYPAPGPGFTPDIAAIGEYAKRMGSTEAMASALNPDLRKFQARGGKLIAYYGWTDAFGGARSIMDYYEMAERVAGGEQKVKEFFRLFMVPGMDHCGGGTGASVFDWVDTLDKWVETGAAPQSVTGFRPGADGKPALTRTIAPYRTGDAR